MPTRTGGTVKEVSRTKGPPTVRQAVVTFPAADPPPPPAEDVVFPDLDAESYDDLRAALGKAVVVDVTTNDPPPAGDGAVTGVRTRKV